MSDTALTRLFFPADPRHPFGFDDGVVNLAKVCGFERGAKVLVLGFGESRTPLWLAKELGCRVVAVESDPASVNRIREEAKRHLLTSVLDVHQVEERQVTFGRGFHSILAEGRLSEPLAEVVDVLKPQLGKNGRIAISVPVRVGRSIASNVQEFWQSQLKGSLPTPNEALQVLEQRGFEPQAVRVLSDSELDDFYREMEKLVRQRAKDTELFQVIREEISTFRTQGSRSNVSMALLVGRRRELGEKPPASRSVG